MPWSHYFSYRSTKGSKSPECTEEAVSSKGKNNLNVDCPTHKACKHHTIYLLQFRPPDFTISGPNKSHPENQNGDGDSLSSGKSAIFCSMDLSRR